VVNGNSAFAGVTFNESRRVALEFIERRLQTLVFANNRLATEVLVTYLKDACDRGRLPSDTVPRVSWRVSCRASAARSSGCCARAKSAPCGDQRAGVGIDIGSLDAV